MPPKKAKAKRSEYVVPTKEGDDDDLVELDADEEEEVEIEEVEGGDAEEEEDEIDLEWAQDPDGEEDEKQSSQTEYLKIVPPEERATSERLTRYEAGRIIGDRARHLENGAPPYIDIKNYTSSIEIAYDELIQRRLPVSVLRGAGCDSKGQKLVEKWKLKEMTICELPPLEWFVTRAS